MDTNYNIPSEMSENVEVTEPDYENEGKSYEDDVAEELVSHNFETTDIILTEDAIIPEDTDIGVYDDSSCRQDWKRTSLTTKEEALIQEMEARGEIDIPEEDLTLAEPQHGELHLPDTSGTFVGERGNSEFIPSKESSLAIMNNYDRESVKYCDGYPDFSPFAKHDSPWGTLDCQVEIGHMTDQRENSPWEYGERPRGHGHDPQYDLGNFAQADNILLERIQVDYPAVTAQDVVSFRKENQLTWHECADGKTMQLVPTAIHDACRHSGGVSEMKYRMAYGDISLPGLED